MAEAILMPKVGISVESCIITSWKKQPGDRVEIGDILFDYETDKSSLECESTAAGILIEIFAGEGDEVPVLTPVCAVGNAGEDVSALRPGGESISNTVAAPEAVKAEAVAEAPPAAAVMLAPQQGESGEHKISPRARQLAKKQSLNLEYAVGTGPAGRIIERDIRTINENGTALGGRLAPGEAAKAPAFTAAETLVARPEYKDIKFTGIRKLISAGMTASLSGIPQLTHNFSFDASEILAYRAKLKRDGEKLKLPQITLNDFILFAVSRILPKYPELNAHMLDANTMRQFSDVNLGMAVDTPRGLLVPKIMQANRKSLAQIAAEAKSLAKQAQEGNISPDLLSGGTFTVSNLGVFGVESFTPVINPPETGILGVNNIIKRVREGKNGEIELYPAMGISLTYDHRAIDGAPASRFARELCDSLENFSLLLAQS